MAVDTYISVDKTKQNGSTLVAAADMFAGFQGLVAKLKNIIGHQNDGATFATVEAKFGLPAGKGTTVVTLINTMDAIVNGATGAGGVTQQGQILDFVGNLAGQ